MKRNKPYDSDDPLVRFTRIDVVHATNRYGSDRTDRSEASTQSSIEMIVDARGQASEEDVEITLTLPQARRMLDELKATLEHVPPSDRGTTTDGERILVEKKAPHAVS